MTVTGFETDAYKFAMAQAGFALRRETFYMSFRAGDYSFMPLDLEAHVRALVGELATAAVDDGFAHRHGYGMSDAMVSALRQGATVDIAAAPQGSWVYRGEPLLTVTGPSFLVSWLEPMVLWLNHPIQLATALRRRVGAGVDVAWVTATCADHQRIIEVALAEAKISGVDVVREDDAYAEAVAERIGGLCAQVGEPGRIFDVGMRSVVCMQQHRIALTAGRDRGLRHTSNLALATELGMIPVGTMGHEHVQRWGSDIVAFRAMRDMRVGPPEYLLDTYDTMGMGIKAAAAVMSETNHACGIRYDSGNKYIQYLHACELMHELGLQPTHVLADGLDRDATAHFERLREFTGWPKEAQIYGYGGYIVASPMTNPFTRDRVGAVYKLSESGGAATMKFGNETGAGKQSIPGRPVIWRRLRGGGPVGIVGQRGEPVSDNYVLLSGNAQALEQLRLCNELQPRAQVPDTGTGVGIGLSPATEQLVAQLKQGQQAP